MFLDLDKKDRNSVAMINDEGAQVTYGELCDFTKEFHTYVNRRCLIFILCENSIGAVAGFVSCISNYIVPLMLNHNTDGQQLENYIDTYRPAYLWVPARMTESYHYPVIAEKYSYALLKTELLGYTLYHDLSLLLTTSGSTGSPKLVRHSYRNVTANAQNVAASFELDSTARAMISLPLNFTQGLSTVTSNLYMEGIVLLTTAALTQKQFWSFFKEQKATSFTGVPYSYEILHKLRFTRMNLPDLRIINQGGGRLSDELFMEFANYAASTGKKFIATYGSTETTSRMSFLNPQLATRKCGSIGTALANGYLSLLDETGNEIFSFGEIGEIIYRGPNVTLGYGECGEDLAKGDERQGIYFTGDMAWRDEDGCYFIVGRKKRFLKLFGYRIGLDETEQLLKNEYGSDFACVGTDKKMIIYIVEADKQQSIHTFITQKSGINAAAFEVRVINSIPRNGSGKTQYKLLPEV